MKLPITHRHSALFKDAQYRKYWPLFTPALARFLTISLHQNNF